MADIFLSYSRTDKPRVAPLVAALEAQGWSVWWDTELAPGEEFDQVTAAELKQCKAVVVVWTPTSVVSRWVRGEARVGADRGVLVPVRFENAEMPIDVRAIHTTDMDAWNGDAKSPAFNRLAQSLKAMIGGSQAKSPPATPRHAPAAPRGLSICVLPFSNMSGDPEQEYFSDGISEDIITDLSRVSALSIIARNSAFAFKGKQVDVLQVARNLGASHVLEGSVRKSGNRVRITAQLIDGSTNNQIWAERFDRDLSDIFALQSEISEAIVKALKLKLIPSEMKAIETRPTTNADAYKLYLMARQFWLLDNERNNEIVIRICQHVIELDPNYAQAWATMALAQWNLFWRAELAHEDLAFAASRALALGPHLPDAHVAVGCAHRSKGDYAAGLEACRRALAIEPKSYVANRMAGLCCMGLRTYDDAVRYFEVAADAMDADFTACIFIVQCMQAMKDPARIATTATRALARIEKVITAEPGHSRAIGLGVYALSVLNERERAIEWATRARLIDPENINLHYNLACAMSALRETDRAIEILEGVAERASPGMLSWIEADSDLDSVRADERYRAIIEKTKARLSRDGDVRA